MTLKLILVSVDGTIGRNGKADSEIVNQLASFAAEMANHGVRIALWSSRRWNFDGKPLEEYLTQRSGVEVRGHGVLWDGSPARPRKNSAIPILQKYGVNRWETLLLGSTDDDMRAGVSNKILYVRANWYGQQTTYGFEVRSVNELRRFCLVFALRQHLVFWGIDWPSASIRAAGPFSTMHAAYTTFGIDAKSAAKYGEGHPDFWFYLMVASLYFSGQLEGVDYICSYPGHRSDADPPPAHGQESVLARLGRCFNMSYFHDLIIRHRTAAKSQNFKAHERKFSTQLSSIHLNKNPTRNLTEPRRTPIKLAGKCVLVVDDIITSGRSLESARAYLEAAGARVKLFGWLKTINSSYTAISQAPKLSPFRPNTISTEPASTLYSYDEFVVDASAPGEINTALASYIAWK